jgi:hypothetical protein
MKKALAVSWLTAVALTLIAADAWLMSCSTALVVVNLVVGAIVVTSAALTTLAPDRPRRSPPPPLPFPFVPRFNVHERLRG